jgi:glutathione S-transferase
MEYLLTRHGGGRLSVGPAESEYPDYLYWFHYANGSLLPAFVVAWIEGTLTSANPILQMMRDRLQRRIALVENHLQKAVYFAGSRFSAADIIMHFPLATMRTFTKLDVSKYPNIMAWLRRVSARPAYQRAMLAAGHDGDPALHGL